MGSAATSDRYGEWEVIRRIAVGGMAEIFEARGPDDASKRFALKVLLPHCAEDPDTVRAFEHEAALATQLDHPNLVRIHSHGREGGTAFLVMDYVDGGTLSDLMRVARREDQRLPASLSLYILRGLLRALDYVHSAHDDNGRALTIVHRDVTPQNVLIDRCGRVLLGDFGIARSNLRDARTRTGVIKGKLRYLAPEQATGSTLDARTDLYAAGLILFELLTGTPYITGDNEIVLLRRAEAPEPRKASEVADVDLAFDAVLERALERFPEARYSTAAAFLRALEKAAAAAGVPISDESLAGWVERLSKQAPASPPEQQATTPLGPRPLPQHAYAPASAASPTPSATTRARSPRTVGWALGAAIATAGVAYWVSTNRTPSTSPSELPSGETRADEQAPGVAPSGESPASSPSAGTPPASSRDAPAASSLAPPRSVPSTKPATTPTDAKGPSAAPSASADPSASRVLAARAKLDSARRSLSSRGILTSDLPASQRTEISLVEQNLSAGRIDAAETQLATLVPALQSQEVTADLVKKKLNSVNAALKAAKARGANTSQLDALVDSALQDFASGRYDAANRRLNEILSRLTKL